MIPHELHCRIKPYIQPFERILALRELEALAGATPAPILENQNSDGNTLSFCILTNHPGDYLADRLTYWESVESPGDSCVRLLTRQVRREATANLVRNGVTPDQLRQLLPFRGSVLLPSHRSLRYGPHGIHEYRGKFFPQLVRSLLNVVGAQRDVLVLDPMCGSGTTAVEGILMGCQAIGLDLNPLSVLISRAKCAILAVDPGRLATEYESLKRDLLRMPDAKAGDGMPWLERLPRDDQEYLTRWFSLEVLAALDVIAMRVSQTSHLACRSLFTVSLSNILRCVSWQRNDDLRVRKEVRPDTDVDVLSDFLTELNRSVRTVLALLYENKDCAVGKAQILEGDARQAASLLADVAGRVDVIITSPPYATALPYLDTDRLSLSYLGLLSRPKHRIRDFDMIGNREISNGQRQDMWDAFDRERSNLPGSVTEVIDRIAALNAGAPVGFRRQNLPSLLARYFLDMRQLLQAFRTLLRPGSRAYVVVGNNHTIAGGQRVDINTDQLLAQLGQSVGLALEGTLEMEMLLSRDIFRKNAGTTETIIEFRNGQ